eukprot:COSAG02_NODE_35338_length_470_cov_0.555256_1_plen_31_part_10
MGVYDAGTRLSASAPPLRPRIHIIDTIKEVV